MKVAIFVLLSLFISCSKNPTGPTEHTLVSGDINGDFGLLVKTTGYHDIGDGAELDVIVGMKNTLTIKDKRLRSVREANRINKINYWKNNALLPDTSKQVPLIFTEGKTDISVEIITANGDYSVDASFFGRKATIPQPITVGNFPRGVLCSDKSIQEELVLLNRYVAIDSATWITSTLERFATGYWFINRRGYKDVSENGVSERMYEFINSNINQSRYVAAINWACQAIMYVGVVDRDSVDAFYLRYIIESPRLESANDNRQSFDLLEKKDYNQFRNLISDIINNPSVYADKSAMDSVSLVDIAIQKKDSLSKLNLY